MFETMNDIPTAVISGVSRGALRSGRYATRSIAALNEREQRDGDRERQDDPADDHEVARAARPDPSTVRSTVLATSPESENTSPWAKLISCRIP